MYQLLKEAKAALTAPEQPFAIEEIQLRGVTIKAYAGAPPSLREAWQMAGGYADNDYLVYGDERWTYTQATAAASGVSNWLIEQGIETGDRVAIAMRNYPEYMLAYWAITSIGAVVVGMNAWWVSDEMAYGLEDSAPKVMICDQERLDRFKQIESGVEHIKLVGVRLPQAVAGVTPWAEVVATGGSLPDATVDPDSDACIFYTSGTTGTPKGAQLTHRGCVNNVMNIAYWAAAQAYIAEKRGLAPSEEQVAAAPQMSALVVTPLFHVTANNCVAHGATLSGGKLVHMYRWDAGEALKIIEAEKITTLSGVPVMSRELLAHPDFAKYDTSTLASVGGGGAQLQPDLVDKIDKGVANARPNTGYGMTETCGVITSNTGDFFVDRPESCGPALPTFDAKCVDDNGNEVALGEVGEFCVKGAPVIKGYLNRPEATAETIVDGWLHTGDIARMDEDGFVYIVDRKKDMVLRGGENIFCAEVESTVFKVEGVAECTVFGVPDDRLGEEVGIAVVVADGVELSGEAIREFCASRMAKFKIPRYIWLMDESLPRNASGKFLKRELRDSLNIADAV